MKFARVFYGAVLQRDRPIKIWGFGAEGEVFVILGGEKRKAEVAGGKFIAEFMPRAGGSEKVPLIAECGAQREQTFVLFGDVFLCAGQSNMAYPLCFAEGEALIRRELGEGVKKILDIYEVRGENGYVLRPETEMPDIEKQWVWRDGCDSEGLKDTSTIPAMVINALYPAAKVPLGVINTACSGLSVDTYLSRAAIDGCPAVKNYLVKTGKYLPRIDNSFGTMNYQQMCGVYNEKIAPLVGLNFKAILWYQGESSALDFASAKYYRRALGLVMDEFGKIFGSIPFIASHIALDYYTYGPDGYQYINEAIDLAAARRKNAVSFPAYDAEKQWRRDDDMTCYDPIHPVNKAKIASRFVKALMPLYGGKSQKVPYISQITGGNGSLVCKIEADSPLKKGKIRGFTVAGENGKYVQAEARVISPCEVEVYSPYVKDPKFLTYAFARYNHRCNLMTEDGEAVKPYRSKYENMDGKGYYQLNFYTDCDTLCGFERNFSGALGAINEPAAFTGGKITRACPVKLSLTRGKDPCIAAKYSCGRGGYFLFGISPEINFAGSDHALGRYKRLTVTMRGEGKAEFLGLLIRENEGRIHLMRGAPSVELCENFASYDIDLETFIEPDLSVRAATPAERAAANEMEFYFRSFGCGRVFIKSIRLHD